MNTIFVVEIKGIVHGEVKECYREQIMKELKEGLVVIDDSITITSHTVQGEIGLEFNME